MSRVLLGVALQCDQCKLFFGSDSLHLRASPDGRGWSSTEVARARAKQCGWLVAVRKQLGPSGKGQPRYTLVDFCPGCSATLTATVIDGVIEHDPGVLPALPHVQRAVLADLCRAPARQWLRTRDLGGDHDQHVAGALAALTEKKWADRRERPVPGPRMMYEYRATKAGRARSKAAT